MTVFTKQERYVIVFLILGAICGLSYSYYKKFHPPIDIRFRHLSDKKAIPTEELEALLKNEKSVNINYASVPELIKLKGIGPALADRIIKDREANGLFKDKDELNNIKGIGPKKFSAIKDYILIK